MAETKTIQAPAQAGRETSGQAPSDADRVRTNILEIATEEFAAKGLSGARIDEIAERTLTSKRMIYYHFGGKEGLYRAVLAHCYGRIRTIESTLDLGGRPPLEALAQLVRFTFDYQMANEEFIRLVMVENIHRAEYVSQMPELQALNLEVIELLRGICERGVAEGVFRPGVDPTDLHMSISALCFFNVANRHTFSVIHEVDMMSAAAKTARRETIVELMLRFVRP